MSDIMSDFISVAEFSRKINETKQKAYSIIERNEYKEYVEVINGIKQVSIDLVEVYLNRNTAPKEEKKKDIKIDNKENINTIPKNNNEAGIDYKYLLDIQNKRIEELEKQIKEKDKVILDYANKFAEMATQAQSIAVSALNTTGQAQYLQATQQATQQAEQTIEVPAHEDKPVAKKTLWQMIFGK